MWLTREESWWEDASEWSTRRRETKRKAGSEHGNQGRCGAKEKEWETTDISDLRGVHSPDLVGDGLGSDINKRLDLEVVGGNDDVEEHTLVLVDAEWGRADTKGPKGQVELMERVNRKMTGSESVSVQVGVPLIELSRPASLLLIKHLLLKGWAAEAPAKGKKIEKVSSADWWDAEGERGGIESRSSLLAIPVFRAPVIDLARPRLVLVGVSLGLGGHGIFSMVLAVLQDLYDTLQRGWSGRKFPEERMWCDGEKRRTFLKTSAVMLGRGMACSGISPRSVEPDQRGGSVITRWTGRHKDKRREGGKGRLTVEHALKQEGALSNLLVDGKLLLVAGLEDDLRWGSGSLRRGNQRCGVEREGESGRKKTRAAQRASSWKVCWWREETMHTEIRYIDPTRKSSVQGKAK
jgi:hypothetical protein